MGESIWVVLDEDKRPIYCAPYPEACHEHINDALMGEQPDGVEKWVVRRALLQEVCRG